MDRTAWVAIILSVIGLVWWNHTITEKQKLRAEAHRKALAEEQAVRAKEGALPPSEIAPGQAAATPAQPAAASTTPAVTAKPDAALKVEELLEVTSPEGSVRYVFTSRGGIRRVDLLKHTAVGTAPVVINSHGTFPIGALFEKVPTITEDYSLRREGTAQIALTSRGEGPLKVEKIFTLPPAEPTKDKYVAELEIRWTNPDRDKALVPSLYVAAGEIAPIHRADQIIYTGMDYFKGGSAHHTPVTWFDRATLPIVGIETRPAMAEYLKEDTEISWVGTRNQFFASLLTPRGTQGTGVWAQRMIVPDFGPGNPVYGIEGALRMPGFEVQAGGTVSQSFQIYTGPRELSRLQKLKQNEADIMNYGFFKLVSEMLLHSMNGLKGLLGNYATAILVLTIIIKLMLYPLQNAATIQMKRMSLLSPKMTELREKYKDNPQKMNEEVMKLYKEFGVNPFSGCLPMLIQIPVFFGFFGMLGTAVELRNSSFLWVKDLSQPDTIGHFGPLPVNILPLLMAGTMFWQMALTPKTGDKMQQRIFMIMPVMFIAFCYNYASALSLYWTAQNIFSIVQLYLTRNQAMPELKRVAPASKVARVNPGMPGAKPKKKRLGRPGGR